MKTRQLFLWGTLLLLLACRITATTTQQPVTSVPIARPFVEPTMTPFPSISMFEMLDLTKQQVQKWSAGNDVHISRNLHCQGILTTDGRCNSWIAEIYSPVNNKMGVIETRGTHVTVRDVYLYQPEKSIINRSNLIDSSTIVPIAVNWIQTHNLWLNHTDTDSFAVQNNNTGCGEGLFYIVSFSLPTMSVCIQPSTGTVTKCIGIGCEN